MAANRLAAVLQGINQWPENERQLFMDLYVRGRSDCETQRVHGLNQSEFEARRSAMLRRFRLKRDLG